MVTYHGCMDLIDVVVIDKGKLPLLTSWGLQMSGMSAKITEREKEKGKEGADGRLHGCTECKTRVHQLCKGSTSSAKGLESRRREVWSESPLLVHTPQAPIVSHTAVQLCTKLRGQHRNIEHLCQERSSFWKQIARERFWTLRFWLFGWESISAPGTKVESYQCVCLTFLWQRGWESIYAPQANWTADMSWGETVPPEIGSF